MAVLRVVLLLLLWLGMTRGVKCFKGVPDPTSPSFIQDPTAADTLPSNPEAPSSHQWLSDEVLYDNWRRLIRRRVQLNSSTTATTAAQDGSTTTSILDYEIVQQRAPDAAVLIVVWDTATHTTTLIREYMPSRKAFGYGLAAGMVDPHHANPAAAARAELQEECQLTIGGSTAPEKQGLLLLTPPEGVVLDKYCTTRMIVYLAIDPIPNKEAVARDAAEEGMQVVEGVPLSTVLRLLRAGEFSVVASWAILLAVRKLRELDLLTQEEDCGFVLDDENSTSWC